MHGMLHLQRTEKFSKVPFFLIFFFTNLVLLSLVGHKEDRFMGQIFLLFGLFWGFFWVWVFEWAAYIDRVRFRFFPHARWLCSLKFVYQLIAIIYALLEVILLL